MTVISATQKRQKAHLKLEEMPYISVGSLDSLNSLSPCLMGLTGSPSQCLATSLFKGVKVCQSRMKVKPASCPSGETPQPQSLSMNFMSPGPFKGHLILFTTLNSSALNQTQQLEADSAPQDHSTFCVSMPFPNSWTPPRGHRVQLICKGLDGRQAQCGLRHPSTPSLPASSQGKGTGGNYFADWLGIVNKIVIRLRVSLSCGPHALPILQSVKMKSTELSSAGMPGTQSNDALCSSKLSND